MSITTAVAIYFLIWWVTLFAVLPWGVRSQDEAGSVSPGTDPGAPVMARVLSKLLWTTVVSALVFCVLFYVFYVRRMITLDDFSAILGMPRER